MKIKITPRDLFITAGVIILLLFQIPLQVVINRRPEHKEIVRVNPFQTLPPVDYLAQYLTATLLGGLRPLVVDYLWMKTADLQKDKKFEEIRTLLELIALLQPRMQEVWTYNAWNLAYNISNQEETYEKQWNWVDEAIKFLKEKGLKHNPESYKITEWIAFIYYHRVPQEPYFMETVAGKHQQDAYGVAAGYYQKTAELARHHSPGREIFYETMYCACRYYHAFELLKKEKFDEAVSELNGLMLYLEKLTPEYPTERYRLISEKNASGQLADIFKLEKKIVLHKKARGRDNEFFSQLTALTGRYASIVHAEFIVDFQPINQRVDVLLNEYVYQTYRLIDQGNFTLARANVLSLIKKTQPLIPPDTENPAYYFYDGLVARFTDFNNIVANECLFRQSLQQNKFNEAAYYLQETVRLLEDYLQNYKIFDLQAESARLHHLKSLGVPEQK